MEAAEAKGQPPREGPRRAAPEPEWDQLRYRVFVGFAAVSGFSSALMMAAELGIRGPAAVQPFAFAAMTGLFAGLLAWVRRTGCTAVPTAVALGAYFVVSATLERLTPGVSEGIRVAMFGLPLAAVLLSGRGMATAFWLLATIDTLAMVPLHGEDVALRALNAVGASFVGIVLVVIGAIFDRERRRAQDLAAAREAELVEAVRAAEAAAEARTTFLANMSHEIRTPMNGVLGLARVLVDEAEAPAQRELAQTILASGQGLLHILDDILDLSKLDAGALHMAPAPTQPRALIEEVRRLMRVKADEARLWLDVDVAEPLPPWVAIDGHRVRQVLTNLLGNAIKFTERGGVTIRASHGAGRLRVAVEDTGIGMTPEGLARAFRPFEQADGSTARRFGGTGLGLAICRRLCELMGGEVWARSAPGAGSTFTFEVAAPLAEAPVGAEPRALAPPSSARVLVAEDNRVNQLVARRLLAKLGAEVEVVTNGREAVEILHREPFDLVLMDLQMPEVDGLEATRRIRAMSGARSSTPIFALTASAMEKERRACAAAGMDGVLTKPIEIDALGRTLAALGAP